MFLSFPTMCVHTYTDTRIDTFARRMRHFCCLHIFPFMQPRDRTVIATVIFPVKWNTYEVSPLTLFAVRSPFTLRTFCVILIEEHFRSLAKQPLIFCAGGTRPTPASSLTGAYPYVSMGKQKIRDHLIFSFTVLHCEGKCDLLNVD